MLNYIKELEIQKYIKRKYAATEMLKFNQNPKQFPTFPQYY